MRIRIILFLSFSSFAAASTMVNQVTYPSLTGLEVIAPFEKTFETEHQVLLDQRRSSSIEQMKPWMILIKNLSGQDIVAYNVKWIVTLPDGRTSEQLISKRQTEYLSFAYPKSKDRIRALPGNIAIQTGQSALLSPSFAIVGSSFSVPDSVLNSNVSGLVSTFDKAASVTISVDSVVFADGTIAGPDVSKLGEHLRKEASTLYNLLGEVTKRNQQGLASNAVFDPLQQNSALKSASGLSADPRAAATHLQQNLKAQTEQGTADAFAVSNQILMIRERLGDQRALEFVLERQFSKTPSFRDLAAPLVFKKSN